MPVTPMPELKVAIEEGKEWFDFLEGSAFPSENNIFTLTLNGADYEFVFGSDEFDNPVWENDTFYVDILENIHDGGYYAIFSNKSGNILVVGQDYTVSISYDKITVSHDFAIAVVKAQDMLNG